MKQILLTLAFLTSVTAHAALAPGYNSLNKMDAAIAALAKGGSKMGLASRNPGDVTVASAQMNESDKGSEIISVDVGNLNCKVAITSTPPPPKGMAGASSQSGKVLACSRYMSFVAVTVMKYEDARPALADAASKNQSDLSFSVVGSAQGPKVKMSK